MPDTTSAELAASVLIVDDYETMLRSIRNLLKQIGFADIDEAGDGGQALRKMRARPYDLVISDWHMRPMDGLELLKEVRADASLGRVPFVMIAADGGREKVTAARAAGVDGYIVKPFSATALKRRLLPVIGPF
jgi:two-component system chemotaxis response regulator CheY